MAVRKIAISLPEDVLRQVDRLAKRTHVTRSGFITRVLTHVSHASTQAEITEQINRLFNEGELAKEQASLADLYLQAAEKGFEDSEW
ncbi:type II toxin-antitoxin system HicB family antitoxin [Bdellovibrionota bacterium FG-1]